MKPKSFPFIFLFITAFLGLWLNLFYLQIVKGAENRGLSQENRIKIIKTPALRGIIYDRNGNILVRNRPEGREYLYGPALAHVLGYIGEISPEELDNFPSYQQGDIIGKVGIEKEYDALLRGKDGGIIVETDVSGKTIREIKKQEPQNGINLNLTLDLNLQKKAFAVLNGRKGVIVITNPRTGAILTLVSFPSFNPNKIEEVLSNPNQSMFNRAISGLYPPGSIFKIVTAIAGLEEGKIDSSTLINDTGEIKIEKYGKEYTYANWYYTQYGKKEGMVDIVKAIKRSNDIYFYKTGEWLGIERLVSWSQYFGLGQQLGIDIPGESKGLVPGPAWKKEQKTESWYLGDTYITAIGQGNLLLTPLQVNQMASVIAVEGKFCQPHLRSDLSTDNLCYDLEIKSESLALVKEGMKQAGEEKGTAPIFADFSPPPACKTGTAEFGDPQDKTHAWFTVFAPLEDPEIVVTVLLEGAGEGSSEAAPVAKEILEYWFKKEAH